jgi:hypothetical protein
LLRFERISLSGKTKEIRRSTTHSLGCLQRKMQSEIGEMVATSKSSRAPEPTLKQSRHQAVQQKWLRLCGRK